MLPLGRRSTSPLSRSWRSGPCARGWRRPPVPPAAPLLLAGPWPRPGGGRLQKEMMVSDGIPAERPQLGAPQRHHGVRHSPLHSCGGGREGDLLGGRRTAGGEECCSSSGGRGGTYRRGTGSVLQTKKFLLFGMCPPGGVLLPPAPPPPPLSPHTHGPGLHGGPASCITSCSGTAGPLRITAEHVNHV